VAYRDVSEKIAIQEYIDARIDDLNLSEKFPPEHVSSSLLWLNWQAFYALVERIGEENRADETTGMNEVGGKILSDLLLILERKELVPFEVLTLSDFERYDIDIGALAEIGRMMKRSFSDLSDISIDVNTFGRIGLLLNDPVPFLSQFRLDPEALTVQLPHTDPSKA
jgi:hypothetical protein